MKALYMLSAYQTATSSCVTFVLGVIWPHHHSIRIYYIQINFKEITVCSNRFEYFDRLHRGPSLLALITGVGFLSAGCSADCSPPCNTFSSLKHKVYDYVSIFSITIAFHIGMMQLYSSYLEIEYPHTSLNISVWIILVL